MQAGSSSEGQAPEQARSRTSSNGCEGGEAKRPLATAVIAGVFALLGALGGAAGVVWQTEREGQLSLRDLRMETYATALQSFYTYRQALDAYHEAALSPAESPEGTKDDEAAIARLESQYPEYLAAWSRVKLLAGTELRRRLDNVSVEITTMRKRIELVTAGTYGGDSLDVYIGSGDPLTKAVLEFQDQAISEARESD